MSKEELAKKEETTMQVVDENTMPLGFEDDDTDDMVIPRVKIVQTLSPERKDGTAKEGDIINSLTLEKLNGKKFIPVFKFNNNIEWKPRSAGGGIACMARDGKVGEATDGTTKMCKACKRCEFDNSKQGAEAIPKCTKYINFFGFFEGERMPIILSFGKTNYNIGRKMYSMAKVTMQNMWNFCYVLQEKLMSKSNNEWYVIDTMAGGQTSDEDRAFAAELYKVYRTNNQFQYDMEEGSSSSSTVDTSNTEF